MATEIEALIAERFRTALRKYHIQGTPENFEGGPPYRAPWLLIDASTAEPEVNWPGELIGEFKEPHEASNEMFRLAAAEACAALSQAGYAVVPREPNEDAMFAGGSSLMYPSIYMGGPPKTAQRDAGRHYRAMIRAADLLNPRRGG